MSRTAIERLPISYFDSTQSGVLISRIMNDAEGIRNLVGTGLGQILGSIVTAVIALALLFYLNWQLTGATVAMFVIDLAFNMLGDSLRDALDPKMKLLVGHGLFDLATPYFGSKVILDQLPAYARSGRVKLVVYPGGHMFYSRDAARQAFHAEVEKVMK